MANVKKVRRPAPHGFTMRQLLTPATVAKLEAMR